MMSNRLQLNADKTEVLWCASDRRQHQLPSGTLTIDCTAVSVVIRPRPRNTYRRRSGDADACLENCVALLRRPPSAAPNSSLSATAYVPVAGGHSSKHATWLYGNGALIGLPVYLTRRLQLVLNAAARLIFNLRRFDHVSDALISHKITIPARERWNKDQKALLPENSRAVYTDGSGGPLGIYFKNLAEDQVYH